MHVLGEGRIPGNSGHVRMPSYFYVPYFSLLYVAKVCLNASLFKRADSLIWNGTDQTVTAARLPCEMPHATRSSGLCREGNYTSRVFVCSDGAFLDASSEK